MKPGHLRPTAEACPVAAATTWSIKKIFQSNVRNAVLLTSATTIAVLLAAGLARAAGEELASANASVARKGGEQTEVETVTALVEEETDGDEIDVENDPKSATTKVIKKSSSKRRDPAGKDDLFRPDPQYARKYDQAEQQEIYGGKFAVEPPRPLIEIGREQYTSGMYEPSGTPLGEKNPLLPGLAVYGDWRTAIAFNGNNGKEIAQVATRLNLDVDFKITATERLHAFFTPITRDNQFTRYEFGGRDGDREFTLEDDLTPQTLFFEGDIGSLYTGFSGHEASFDLPFAVGLFPLFLQNGIWANDAILGGAFSLPAKNSATFGLSNFDITFFAAFDDVDNPGLLGLNGANNNLANLYGITAFIDAFDGYIEAGYGIINAQGSQEGTTHFLTAAYSRRWENTLSNTTRVFANFGDDPEGDSDGLAIISENSLITSLPSTLIPYANFFVGLGTPQPLVDGFNAGILKNIGINFETDALTGYPKLDDTGSNAMGGAIGLQYLFNLDQQIVLELATVLPFEDDGVGAKYPQYALGLRYQIPLDHAWLFRADATYQILEGAEDNFGIRTELRRKF